MSKAHIHAQTRGHRRSVQLPQPIEEERDRKRSAPPATSFVEDETPRPRSKPNSRRSSGLSRDTLSSSPTPRKMRPPPSMSSQGFVNPAYVGSVNSVPAAVNLHVGGVQQTGVIREQYCSCARWSRLERTLLIAVAVLAGIVVGLVAVVSMLAIADPEAAPGFMRSAPVATSSVSAAATALAPQ